MWRGAYFDGFSARLISVRVGFGTDALHLQDVADNSEIIWPYRDIKLVSSGSDGERAELSCVSLPAARLRLEGPGVLQELRERVAGLGKTDWRRGAKLTGGITVALGVLLAILYFLPVLIVPLIPDNYARRMGDGISSQILAAFGGACKGEAGMDILDLLVADLLPEDTKASRIRVDVVDSPIVNAVALPGGRILFFRGLIDKARSADEIAGVLAHEIGHVRHRHGLENMTRALGFQMVLGALLGGFTGEAGELMLSTSFSREAEREADRTAISLLNSAGISAEPLAAFFDRMGGNPDAGEEERKGEKEGAGFFRTVGSLVSTHPASPERAALARMQGLGPARPALDAGEWSDLQSICRSGEDEDEQPY